MPFCLLNISCDKPKKSMIFTDAGFTEGIEGPASSSNGDLYVVNFIKDGTIGRALKGEKYVRLFLSLPEGSIGNGIRFLNDSIFYVADYKAHQILKVNTINKVASTFAIDSNMNQPNDIAIMRNGILFASDPNWKNNTGQLWKIDKDAKTHLLEKNMGTTNGIEVSPNDEFLYVNESIQRKIWKYNLDKSGNVSNKTLFYSFKDFGLDGMRCDSVGNLYVARYDKGTIAVLSPKGELLEEIILVGKKPTNVTFGGIGFKSVFVTLQDKKWVEVFKADFRGREPFN